MKRLLKVILKLVRELKRYLLNANCLLLEPEYIFMENDSYFFCYYPNREKSIRTSFHELTEFFVQRTDYQDEESVKLSFLLHRETMEENYSLGKILKKIRQEEGENPKETDARKAPAEELFAEGAYETAEHDWITNQEMGSTILEETENLWTPMKRFLQKHKKPKWGDFDGIYIDQEQFFE